MSDVKFCGLVKIPKIICVFASDFTQMSLSKSIEFCSSFISSINFFAFKPNLMKEALAFGSFEAALLFSIAFNCYFFDLQSLVAAVPSYLQYFSVSSKVRLHFLLLLSPYLEIYSMENNQI